jgi:RNA polymerase sigma factor (sigma-70 family)
VKRVNFHAQAWNIPQFLSLRKGIYHQNSLDCAGNARLNNKRIAGTSFAVQMNGGWFCKELSAKQKAMGRPTPILKIKRTPDIRFKASTIERSDAQLLLACRRGEESAWDALVGRFQRLVSSVPRRAGLSEDVVADIFQEVFLTLFEKLDKIKQPESLRAWLVTTAKFMTWQYVSRVMTPNRRLRECTDLEGKTIFEIPDKGLLPDDILIRLEEQHLIRTAVAGLDKRSQTILNMLYSNEGAASYAEVAAQLGVGESSISPMRARCFKKLVKVLAH